MKIEIDIEIYDEKEAVIRGEYNIEYVSSKAYVDLDKVEMIWRDPEHGTKMHFISGGSVVTKTYTYEHLSEMWLKGKGSKDMCYVCNSYNLCKKTKS